MEVLSSPSELHSQFSFCLSSDVNQTLDSQEGLFCMSEHKEIHAETDFEESKLDSQRTDNMAFLESAAYLLPHPSKVWKGGEDAHFITSKVIGIADGVGGWADMGVDPALYAIKLMEGAKDAVEKLQVEDPLSVLRLAYEHSKDVQGSSTACIITLQPDGEHVDTCNLGDSGFMLVRDSKIVYRSKEQQYAFNFPFQLGTNSDCMPENSQYVCLYVEEGDLLILGTDGLWDNLFDDTILELTQTSDDVGILAEAIASHARNISHALVTTPFSRAATAAGHPFVIGGKVDDISVVVARVHKRPAKGETTNGQS